MLIPIGQESDTVRRVPWVTIAIMGLCVIIHIFNAGAINEYEDKLFDIYSEIYEYYTSHPYLELDQELKQTFMITEEMEEVIRTMTADKYGTAPTESEIEEEQAYLDNLVEELDFTKESLPFYKFVWSPKISLLLGLLLTCFCTPDGYIYWGIYYIFTCWGPLSKMPGGNRLMPYFIWVPGSWRLWRLLRTILIPGYLW